MDALEILRAKLHDLMHESCATQQVFKVDVPAAKCWEFVGILADVRRAMGPLYLRVLLTTMPDDVVMVRWMTSTFTHNHDECEEGPADIEIDDQRD